jgi:alpha-1,4-digalacturonate transport system substrate-binding protein
MKRIGLTLLCLVLALSLFAGGASEKQKSGVVKLEILLSDDTLEGGAMAKAVDRFNQEYADKGIQAEINEVAYADIKSQIQNRATANDLPALIKTTHFEQYTDYIYPLDGVCDYTPDDFAVNGVRARTVSRYAGQHDGRRYGDQQDGVRQGRGFLSGQRGRPLDVG